MRVRATLFGLLLVPLVASAVLAQERAGPGATLLRGSIVDRATRAPLAGAAVEFVELDRTLVANAQGRILLDGVPAGAYSVRVRQLGFEEFAGTLSVSGEEMDFTVALGARPVILEGVSAQGYRFGHQLERRRLAYGGSARVVPRQSLTSSTAPTARDALRDLGMISLIPCGAAGSSGCVLARGRQVSPRVVIDERPAFGLYELSLYRPQDIYSVEIYAGGRHIRAYTSRWVEREGRAGRRALQPLAVF